MYEAHYGLTSKPFQLIPDPNFYFGSKQHSRAKAYLNTASRATKVLSSSPARSAPARPPSCAR
jgi:hypothetical protein